MSREQNKINAKKKSIIIRTIVFFLVCVVLASTYFFIEQIEKFVNFAYNDEALSTKIDTKGLIFHFIDVGQGDAILIEFPTGEKMLVDAGDSSNVSKQKLISYLSNLDFEQKNGEKIIDYFVLTHSDSDHSGGAKMIFDKFLIETFYRPDILSKNEETVDKNIAVCETITYSNVISASKSEGCSVVVACEGRKITSNSFVKSELNNDNQTWQINFLTPIARCLPYKSGSHFEFNNYSPIMIFEYMGKKVMLTGDAEKEVERDLINKYSNKISFLDVDILKLGHHGSDSSTTPAFLEAVKPEYAIIMVGEDNKYNHPSNSTISNLSNYGMNSNNIYRTDKNGNITVGIGVDGKLSLEANSVSYTTFRIEWWQLFSSGTLIAFIVIYSPYMSKKFRSKLENRVSK